MLFSGALTEEAPRPLQIGLSVAAAAPERQITEAVGCRVGDSRGQSGTPSWPPVEIEAEAPGMIIAAEILIPVVIFTHQVFRVEINIEVERLERRETEGETMN